MVIAPQILGEIGFVNIDNVTILDPNGGEKTIGQLPLFIANSDVVLLKHNRRLVLMTYVDKKKPTHINMFWAGTNILHAKIAKTKITINDRYCIDGTQLTSLQDHENIQDMGQVHLKLDAAENVHFTVRFYLESRTFEFNVSAGGTVFVRNGAINGKLELYD